MSDAYLMFERVMLLGIKQLFYNEEVTPEEDVSVIEGQDRIKKYQDLQQKKVDSQKTQLKKRANKIVNHFLKGIEPSIYTSIHENEIQPEMFLLKWLRVLFTREFDLNSLLYVWDFIFASIPEDTRLGLSSKLVNYDVYDHKDYFESDVDPMSSLDYLAVAMIIDKKQHIVGKQFIEIFMALN